MTGHGKVRLDGSDRDVDFYRQLPYPDDQREDKFHKSHNLFHMGPSGIQRITSARWDITNQITLKLTVEWQSREKKSEGGQPLIIEQRRYDIFQRGELTIIDQFSQLVPATKPLTLKADRHSFVGVRVHDLIDPDEGGVMRDSERRINPDASSHGSPVADFDRFPCPFEKRLYPSLFSFFVFLRGPQTRFI